jgi:hypothetical protein
LHEQSIGISHETARASLTEAKALKVNLSRAAEEGVAPLCQPNCAMNNLRALLPPDVLREYCFAQNGSAKPLSKL